MGPTARTDHPQQGIIAMPEGEEPREPSGGELQEGEPNQGAAGRERETRVDVLCREIWGSSKGTREQQKGAGNQSVSRWCRELGSCRMGEGTREQREGGWMAPGNCKRVEASDQSAAGNEREPE